jgi:hypothetical protein
MTGALAEKLAMEEFEQLYEDIRQREVAMTQILAFTITGFTALTTAISAFVFQNHQKESVVYSYLILITQPTLAFSLAMLSGHRDDIIKIEYYIGVFYEEKYDKVKWITRKAKFKLFDPSNSHDATSLIFWTLFAISSGLFISSLYYHNSSLINSALILGPATLMFTQHKRFHRSRSSIRDTWCLIRDGDARKSCIVGHD